MRMALVAQERHLYSLLRFIRHLNLFTLVPSVVQVAAAPTRSRRAAPRPTAVVQPSAPATTGTRVSVMAMCAVSLAVVEMHATTASTAAVVPPALAARAPKHQSHTGMSTEREKRNRRDHML